MVKQLRDATSAGMMDCKRALEETAGDFDAAVKQLREKGMASAAKRAGRETTEGRVLVGVEGSAGAIVAVGCETEPVSKNEEFQAFADKALATLLAGGEGASARTFGSSAPRRSTVATVPSSPSTYTRRRTRSACCSR